MVVDDLVRAIRRKDYVEVRNRFREISRECGIDDERIGFFGEVSYPGISDLDALVVADAVSIKSLQGHFDKERQTSKEFAYIFWHPPLLILNEAWKCAQSLHTLNSLKFLALSDEYQGKVTIRSEECDWLLHVVWFTFLTGVIAKVLFHRAQSLRMLLLVQKNLEYSLQYFSSACGAPQTFEVSSSELRQCVFKDREKEKSWVFDLLFSHFSVVCAAFDRFCTTISGPHSLGEDVGQWQFSERRVIIKKSNRTSLSRTRWFSLVETNPLAFALLTSFTGNTSALPAMEDYKRTFYKAHKIYRKNDLTSVFVTPFATPVDGSKAGIVKIANRVLQRVS